MNEEAKISTGKYEKENDDLPTRNEVSRGITVHLKAGNKSSRTCAEEVDHHASAQVARLGNKVNQARGGQGGF